MTTQTLEKTVRKLSREVANLRLFLIKSVTSEDDEGKYKPTFVKKVFKDLKTKPTLEYMKRGDLLRYTKNA